MSRNYRRRTFHLRALTAFAAPLPDLNLNIHILSSPLRCTNQVLSRLHKETSILQSTNFKHQTVLQIKNGGDSTQILAKI